MNKTILISIIVVIAIVVVVLIAKPFSRKEKPIPVEQAPEAQVTPPLSAKEDSTASINQALEAVETIDLDKEFQAIDADLQNL